MLQSMVLATVLAVGPTPALKFDVVGASLFKNGYAVVTREAAVPESGEFILSDIPQATIGTFWVTATDGTKVEAIIHTTEPKKTTRAATNIQEILSFNIGKVIHLIVNGKTLSGKLLAAEQAYIVLQVGDSVKVYPSYSMEIEGDGDLKISTDTTTQEHVLKFKVKAGANAKLRIMTLERGLSWSPSYLMELGEGDKFNLTAKCTVINDLQDIDGRNLRLVTGYPNLPLLGQIDPFVLTQTIIRNYGMQDAGRFSQQSGGFGGGGFAMNAPSVAESFVSTAVETGSNEDLFYYNLPHATLKQGDRSYEILFEKEGTFDHLYTLDIAEGQENQPRPQNVQFPGLDVWHCIRFKNPLAQPLTTAPILVMSRGEVVGQSTLNYTPTGTQGLVQISKALEIQAEAAVEEVGRKRLEWPTTYRAVADQITLKGTIKLTNHKWDTVRVRIAKDLTGEVLTVDTDGKAVKTGQALNELNPHTQIKWEQSIPKDGVLTLTYTYKVLQ